MLSDLEEVLLPIKSSINSNTTISFKSNNTSLEIYRQTQFVMVPIYVENNQIQDTILFIEDLAFQNNNDSNYYYKNEIIRINTNERFRALLIRR